MKRLHGPSVVSTIMLLFVVSRVAAQGATGPTSELEALVRTALKNNPALQAQRERILAAEQVPSQAGALPDPTADVEFMNLSLDHFSVSDALSKSASIGVTQPLPFPGKRRLAREAAQRRADVERARLAAMESEVRAQVVEAAYSVVLESRLLELNTDTQDALQAAAKSAAGVYAAGMGTQADVLLAQTALTKAQSDRKDLIQQEAVALAQLSRLLASPVDPASVAAIPLAVPGDLPSLDRLLAQLPATAPQVMAAKADEAAREADVAAARRNFKPDFVVGGRYRHDDMSMGGGDFLTAMVGVTLPFFHRKDRYQPALQQALDERESARYGTQDALVSDRYALTEAYESARRDSKVFALYDKGLLLQARQAYESALASYGFGKADFTTLLMALTNYYGFQGEALQAQADFHRSSARIRQVLGHDPSSLEGPGPAPNPTAPSEEKKP